MYRESGWIDGQGNLIDFDSAVDGRGR
jgi:hypothetical protein